MKKLIRKGVFETNSSSSHSIAIASEDKEFVLDTIYPDQNGTIIIRGDEFGWEWFKHNDAQTKATYAAQQFCNNEYALETLEYVIKEQTGAERVIFEGLNDGYIDHDSVGIVSSKADDLKNFIFNRNSWLFGGNDNSEPNPTFYHVPEIRGGKQILPTYKYELSIDDLGKSTKFLDKPTDEEIASAISSLLDGEFLNSDGSLAFKGDIFWQISRQRNLFEIAWEIKQDYSKNEVIFSNEAFNMHAFKEQYKEELKDLSWDERSEFITNALKQIPGVLIIKKFTLNEL